MARIARLVIPSIAHHITQRGNRNQPVFFKPEDKQEYLHLLKQYGEQEGIDYLAYCLMDNHVHILAIPKTEQSLTRGIGEAHRRYTRMINFRYSWRGYLFQGRFHSSPLDERHLLEAARYIELNPVRAHITAKAEDYEYSSAQYHLGAKPDLLIAQNPFKEQIPDWGGFLQEKIDQETMATIRRHTQTGRPCGSWEFIRMLEAQTGRELIPRRAGRKRRIGIVSPE